MKKPENPYIEFPDGGFRKTDEFCYLAKFFKENRCYTHYPKGTLKYKEFWQDCHKKCLEGMTNSLGISITGQYFFYLNFYQILGRDEATNKKGKIFPRFVDLDWEYFELLKYCKDNEKSFEAVKGRRQGWSYKASGVCLHEYSFFRDSSSIIGAFLSDFSQNTMNMVIDGANFLNANTEFKKQRNPDTKEFIQAKYQVDIGGTKVWKGYHSKVQSITYKNNDFAAVGKNATWLIIDEAGVFPNIQEAYNVSEPLIRDGSNYTGVGILFGSAGNMEEGSQYFYEMFIKPDNYNMLAFPDPDNMEKVTGFFSSAAKGRWGKCRDPKSIWYGKQMVDEDGNSNFEAATNDIMWERENKKRNNDNKALHDFITQFPLSYKEAFMRTSYSPYPIYQLNERLGELETTKSITDGYWIGRITQKEGNVTEFKNTSDIPITDFPSRDNKNMYGAIHIFEQPYEDNPPFGVYIAGCLTPGEKVMTEKGLLNIEDVTLDNKLISENGDLVEIINLQQYDVKNENTYKLKISNTFRETNFTKEHPILSSKRITKYNTKSDRQRQYEFDFRYKTVDKLEINDWIKVPNIYKKEINNFENKWDNSMTRVDKLVENPLHKEEFWWLVGIWLGDGWCESNKHQISVAFNKKETLYIEKFINVVELLFNRKVTIRDRNNGAIELNFSMVQLSTFLTNNFGKYAYGKLIPEWVKYINKEFKKNLILGYLDSDGCVMESNNGYTTNFVSINLELLESIQDILFSINCISSLKLLRDESEHLIIDKLCKTKKTYKLNLSHFDTIRFLELFKEDKLSIKLDRINKNKYSKRNEPSMFRCSFSNDYEFIYFQVRGIEKNKYTGIVYNFECETHTFMCHHITTHNCDTYDDDTSTTTSLGSTLILNTLTDRIVAEYTGRPDTAKEYYESIRKLLMYYNAPCNYENNKKGLFAYFENKNALYLLADTPKILKDQQIIKTTYTSGNNSKGTTASDSVKSFGRSLINSYLRGQAYAKDSGITNAQILPSVPLIKELTSWNSEGNFDRHDSLAMLMILREDRLKMIEQNSQFDKPKDLATDDYFTRNFKGAKKNDWANSIRFS